MIKIYKIAFFVAVINLIIINLVNISNPILEQHGFRQSQTALSAFYLIKNGFSLDYITPVIGEGWSIPFEFPIYQYLVALIYKGINIELTIIGRALSILFTLLCCIPVYKSLEVFDVKKVAIYLVLIIFLTSPIYLFWSGTFMIEPTALFFSLMSLYFFLRISNHKYSTLNINYLSYVILLLFFLILAFLQKITTILPIFLLMIIINFYQIYLNPKKIEIVKFVLINIILLLSLSIGYLWVNYSDTIKLMNPIGKYLTSTELRLWNFGTLEQRFSYKFIIDTIIIRNLIGSGLYGIGLIIIIYSTYKIKIIRVITLISLVMYLLPLYIFTNLHTKHNYYQFSNTIFLSVSLGISIYYLIYNKSKKIQAIVISMLFISNISIFGIQYSKAKFTHINANNRSLQIAEFIRANTLDDEIFIVFGYDWSSELAFYSKRKLLMAPHFYSLDLDIAINHDLYLPNSIVAGLILCPTDDYEIIKTRIKENHIIKNTSSVNNCEAFLLR